MKYKWKVQPIPTGRYRSFEHRGFPEAEYENGETAALILCDDEYYPPDVKIGNHKPLKLRITVHSVIPWKWMTVKGEFKTLKEAKNKFDELIKKYSYIMPKEKEESKL